MRILGSIRIAGRTATGFIIYTKGSVLHSCRNGDQASRLRRINVKRSSGFNPSYRAVYGLDIFMTVKVKRNMINAGVTSPFSLYDPEIATFDEDDVYDQKDSAGFINLFGLPVKVKAQTDAKNKK